METPTILPKDVRLEEQPKENPAEEMKLDLPRIEHCISHYDKEKKMFWVAIPIDKTDPFLAICIFDNQKLTYVNAFGEIMKELREKQSRIVTPGMLNRMRDNFLRRKQK